MLYFLRINKFYLTFFRNQLFNKINRIFPNFRGTRKFLSLKKKRKKLKRNKNKYIK
jgi:hypothetical protein